MNDLAADYEMAMSQQLEKDEKAKVQQDLEQEEAGVFRVDETPSLDRVGAVSRDSTPSSEQAGAYRILPQTTNDTRATSVFYGDHDTEQAVLSSHGTVVATEVTTVRRVPSEPVVLLAAEARTENSSSLLSDKGARRKCFIITGVVLLVIMVAIVVGAVAVANLVGSSNSSLPPQEDPLVPIPTECATEQQKYEQCLDFNSEESPNCGACLAAAMTSVSVDSACEDIESGFCPQYRACDCTVRCRDLYMKFFVCTHGGADRCDGQFCPSMLAEVSSIPSVSPVSSPISVIGTTPSQNPTRAEVGDLVPSPGVIPNETLSPTMIVANMTQNETEFTSSPSMMPTLAPASTETEPSPAVAPTVAPVLPPAQESSPISMPSLQPSLETEEELVTSSPLANPTRRPTSQPTRSLTESPTPSTTARPTVVLTETPTRRPTNRPSERPTPSPTDRPTPRPTDEPTEVPTAEPTEDPTLDPTSEPSPLPTSNPTRRPTRRPTSPPGQPDICQPSADAVQACFADVYGTATGFSFTITCSVCFDTCTTPVCGQIGSSLQLLDSLFCDMVEDVCSSQCSVCAFPLKQLAACDVFGHQGSLSSC